MGNEITDMGFLFFTKRVRWRYIIMINDCCIQHVNIFVCGDFHAIVRSKMEYYYILGLEFGGID